MSALCPVTSSVPFCRAVLLVSCTDIFVEDERIARVTLMPKLDTAVTGVGFTAELEENANSRPLASGRRMPKRTISSTPIFESSLQSERM